jgi:hypothetical protein
MYAPPPVLGSLCTLRLGVKPLFAVLGRLRENGDRDLIDFDFDFDPVKNGSARVVNGLAE